MVLGSYKRNKWLKSASGLKSFITNQNPKPRGRERGERHTRLVTYSSEEEEPLERSKKTMASAAVGCETARARKASEEAAIAWEGRKE
jgi:hypothetical protein